ncbi:hypothetical protein AB5J62_36000 [Amycolatopsis sp. cg5]|uniref:hypothetical protein n=1 Tax=Amycolatopsis sp. cg5 TaxID=3238802 RepID=UPI0035231AE2
MSITLGRPVAAVEERPRAGKRRAVWLAAGVGVLGVVLVGRIGRFGFNPTDQGFVLAQSWRLLHGELPHADFTSPRPLGSAVLHMVDFLVPAPLFVSSSFVMMVELTVATIALAALLTRSGPTAWGPSRLGMVAAATMVNLHTYPLMAWHTVDGVFLVATGLWAVDSGKRRTGFFLLGFAVIVKQSFAPALVLGLLLVVLHPARRQWQRIGVDLLFLAAAPLSYYVLIGGGFPAAKEQLTTATGTWGERLLEIADVAAIVQAAVVLAVLAAAWLARERLGKAGRWLRIGLAVAVAAITVSVVVRGHLAHAGDWSITLLWIFVAAAAADAVIQRRFPWRYLSVAALAWMASLSWGYPYPGLVAGSMALGTLEVLARTVDLRARWAEALGPIAAVLVALQLVNAHDAAPYADRPQARLTHDLGDISPSLLWVRTNPSVHAYLAQLRDCVAKYPAAKVAIMPDNAFAYPALNLRNPFPMDWVLPMEVVGDTEQRMLDTIGELNRDGDYLVLFQTVTAQALAAGEPVPASVPPGSRPAYHTGLEERILDRLTGEHITCGNFVGVHSAKS